MPKITIEQQAELFALHLTRAQAEIDRLKHVLERILFLWASGQHDEIFETAKGGLRGE